MSSMSIGLLLVMIIKLRKFRVKYSFKSMTPCSISPDPRAKPETPLNLKPLKK